jgi:hypothetical protein
MIATVMSFAAVNSHMRRIRPRTKRSTRKKRQPRFSDSDIERYHHPQYSPQTPLRIGAAFSAIGQLLGLILVALRPIARSFTWLRRSYRRRRGN